MDDVNNLIPFILAQLIDEIGGLVELDGEQLMESVKSGKYKQFGISIKNKKVIVEIIDEN